ncbi:hypothetical protein N7523_003379 [Penicillium sp. IBT 18751x]|nr:hypothetical protein N7523_003379 [Penicillium sp. IBT 18751x]
MSESVPTTTPNPLYQALPQSQEEDHHDEPDSTKSKLQPALTFSKAWAWEAAGIFTSAALILSIVFILEKYDGREQPNWKLISLNSVVSWLSTLSKACVLFSISDAIGQMKWVWFSRQSRPLSDLDTFDSASRGVTGSAALLWLVKGRNLAAIGSLAMILSIGFDPFVQNLIHYVPHDTEDPSQVSLIASTWGYNTLGPLIGASDFFVDPILKANVYSALFNLDSSQPWAVPQYTCPTGNCTWDAMASLGIGASCSDITSELKTTCFPITFTTDDFAEGSLNCTVSLNSGVTLRYFTNWGSAQPIVVNAVPANWSSIAVHQNSIFPVIQYILANGFNQKAAEGGMMANDIGNTTEFIATECALQPIVRSFNASVNMGVYQEEQLAEWADIMTNYGYGGNNTPFSLPADVPAGDYGFLLDPSWKETFGMKEDQFFTMTYEAMTAIRVFLADLFSGYALAQSDSFSFQRTDDNTGAYATGDALEAIFFNNVTQLGCLDNDQLTCAIKNVASAMSKTIRDSAFTGNVSYEPLLENGTFVKMTTVGHTTVGHTLITVPYITIHWKLLALPVAVWMLGTLSCICSAWSTHRLHLQTWMNSVLPLAARPCGEEHLNSGSQNCSVVKNGVSNNAETRDVERYQTLLCYNESLDEHVRRAKQTQAKLGIRKYS